MALMALTGRRPAEIFFSAKFTLPKKKLSYPSVTFEGQLKTRNAPGTSFEPYQIVPLRAINGSFFTLITTEVLGGSMGWEVSV
jgi:telomere resolvase